MRRTYDNTSQSYVKKEMNGTTHASEMCQTMGPRSQMSLSTMQRSSIFCLATSGAAAAGTASASQDDEASWSGAFFAIFSCSPGVVHGTHATPQPKSSAASRQQTSRRILGGECRVSPGARPLETTQEVPSAAHLSKDTCGDR